jgi:hypothetical protein
MPALAFARLVDEFAERFARDNPHFDRVAFMRACLGP